LGDAALRGVSAIELKTIVHARILNPIAIASVESPINWAARVSDLFADCQTACEGRDTACTLGAELVLTFDHARDAIRCAQAILEIGSSRELLIAAVIHTGEVVPTDIRGAGVPFLLAGAVSDMVIAAGILLTEQARVAAGLDPESLEPIPGQTIRSLSPPVSLWSMDSRSGKSIVISSSRTSQAVGSQSLLTPRQMEIARLIARGYSNRQIAEEANIAYATVERHVSNILSRLQFHGRGQVALWVLRQEREESR
jgi:DNA-binding CsgD family transcriptional regulator